MKVKRKIIEIDDELCDGCGQCVPSCAEGAIQIIDGKARLLEEKYCDGLGACLGDCPTGALTVVEREVDEFDEEAVEKHLSSKTQKVLPDEASLPCGCPSTQMQTFAPHASHLSHWPVKIRLVPVNASFLKGADLLVLADCVPIAYPRFHEDFIKGKVVMAGCPKFDNVQEYIEKFIEIFKTADIKSITVPIMEVPCCSGLPGILKKAMEEAKTEIPMEEVVISAVGRVLQK